MHTKPVYSLKNICVNISNYISMTGLTALLRRNMKGYAYWYAY